MKTVEHFEQLYQIAKEDGIKSAFDYDAKITSERNILLSSAYKSARQALTEGYGLATKGSEFEYSTDNTELNISDLCKLCLTLPFRVTGGCIGGLELSTKIAAQMFSEHHKKIE